MPVRRWRTRSSSVKSFSSVSTVSSVSCSSTSSSAAARRRRAKKAARERKRLEHSLRDACLRNAVSALLQAPKAAVSIRDADTGGSLLHVCAKAGKLPAAGALLRSAGRFQRVLSLKDVSGRTAAVVAHDSRHWLLAHLLARAATGTQPLFKPVWGGAQCPICADTSGSRGGLAGEVSECGWPWRDGAEAEATLLRLSRRVGRRRPQHRDATPELGEKRRREARAAWEEGDRRRQGQATWERFRPDWAQARSSAAERNECRVREFEAAAGDAPLRAGDIPWPELSGDGGLPVPACCAHDPDERQRFVRAMWMRWHPDRFMARWGARIVDGDRALAAERCNAVAKLVAEL